RRHTRSKRDWSSDVCSSDLQHRRHQKQPKRNRRVRIPLENIELRNQPTTKPKQEGQEKKQPQIPIKKNPHLARLRPGTIIHPKSPPEPHKKRRGSSGTTQQHLHLPPPEYQRKGKVNTRPKIRG